MIPSRRWFPGTLQERAAWLQNFNTQFAIVAVVPLGFVSADITFVDRDNEDMQFLANFTVELEAYKDAVRQYRLIITEGDIGDPKPVFPAAPLGGPPNQLDPGMFERIDRLVKRIRAAPNYTDEIGALLGIIPQTPDPINPTELKPVIKAGDSFGGYKFDVNVTRLGQEAFKVQVQKKGQSTWTDAAFATNNPVEVTVTPTTPGDPERILVRAILLEKNQPVGQPSDPTYVTVNP